MTTMFPLQIFYDGSCPVCSAEMKSYQQDNPEGRFEFIDISAENFNAQKYGKTLAEFMAALHVRDASGVSFTGIDAFAAIWQAYPVGSPWRLVSALIHLPGISLLSRIGYRVFARNRHLLPKRRPGCESGSCH